MLKINQIPDKPDSIEVEKNGNPLVKAAGYFANSSGDIVVVFSRVTGLRAFDSHFSELYINDTPVSSAEEAVIELNSFIGLGFKSGSDASTGEGGVVVSPTVIDGGTF